MRRSVEGVGVLLLTSDRSGDRDMKIFEIRSSRNASNILGYALCRAFRLSMSNIFQLKIPLPRRAYSPSVA